ncbi:hypothetical protein L228DRAFT_236933 [Xylona heveae TC161]|uniref:Uncharacterized protein n=1 Tax=Xylona heveae (strain CBS 132557 / TC161) TaxID=1328760 RepID=A0A165HUR9_XYLHT|nr:hypothetical protein L228DRAFT_236933 [Xylona heveae TC161]KZF23952.1 hypothetical protein L228DRAFT_236933 [Xylona heveae TC161]
MESTALVTFLLQTPSTVHSAALRGSWDNFANAYPMQKDFRKGRGHWRGCHSFKDIICDGDSQATLQRRNGALKMGERYWYYYQLNGDEDYHNPGQSFTTACPFLPGQPVHVLDMPIESPAENFGGVEEYTFAPAFTMNPEDKYLAPRTPPIPRPFKEQRLSTSSRRSSRKSRGRFPTHSRTAKVSKGKPINFSRLLRRPNRRQEIATAVPFRISSPSVDGRRSHHSAGAVMQWGTWPHPLEHDEPQIGRRASLESIYCTGGRDATVWERSHRPSAHHSTRPQSSYRPDLANASPLGSHPPDASIRRECESLTRRYKGLSAMQPGLPLYFLPNQDRSSAGSDRNLSELSSEEIQIGLLDEPEKTLLASIESSSQATEIEDDGDYYTAEDEDIGDELVRSPSPCSSEKLSRIPTITPEGTFSAIDLLNKRLPAVPQSPPPETVWARSHSRSKSLDTPSSVSHNVHYCRPRSKSSPKASRFVPSEAIEAENKAIEPQPAQKNPAFSPRPVLKSHFSDWTTTTAASADSPASTCVSPTLGVEGDLAFESPNIGSTTDDTYSPQSYFGFSEQTTPALSVDGFSEHTECEADQIDATGLKTQAGCLSQHIPLVDRTAKNANDPAFITDSTDTLSSLTGLRIDTSQQRATHQPNEDPRVILEKETSGDLDAQIDFQSAGSDADPVQNDASRDPDITPRKPSLAEESGLTREASTRSKFSIPLMVDLDLPDYHISFPLHSQSSSTPTKKVEEQDVDPEAFYLHQEYHYPAVPRPTPFANATRPSKPEHSNRTASASHDVSETLHTPTSHRNTSSFTSPASKLTSTFTSPMTRTEVSAFTPLSYYSSSFQPAAPVKTTPTPHYHDDHCRRWSRDSHVFEDSPGSSASDKPTLDVDIPSNISGMDDLLTDLGYLGAIVV